MATKQQGKRFTANMLVTAVVGVELSAKTLEDALDQARTLNCASCIEVTTGEMQDSTFLLIGVSSDQWINY